MCKQFCFQLFGEKTGKYFEWTVVSVELCQVWSVEVCQVWSVELCQVWSVELWSFVKCGVWSVECGVVERCALECIFQGARIRSLLCEGRR